MSIAYDILREANEPLYMSEILKRAKERFGIDIDRESERFEFSNIWLGFHFLPDFLKNQDSLEDITDNRGSPRNRPASETQSSPLRLRKNQLLHQGRSLPPQQTEDPGTEKRRGSRPNGRHGPATQAHQPFHRQSHPCHEKNVQQQLPASKTLSPRSGRPKVYRHSDPTGVTCQTEGPRPVSSNLNQWNPFFFFLPSVILSADSARKSPASTAEGLPASPKTAPGTDPLSS